MTFDHVIRSFLNNEGKRFKRRAWDRGLSIRRGKLAGSPDDRVLQDDNQAWFAGPSLLADDWEEVQE